MQAPADTELPPPPPNFDPGFDPVFFSPWMVLHHPAMILQSPFVLLLGAFWVWMLVHCARNDPERGLWLWILFIGNVPAAFIYFLVRWLPGARVSGGNSLLKRWTKGRQIPQLEAAARRIGNAHQFVELGDAYRETRKIDRAAECYRNALAKDGQNLPALWGAAQVEMQRQNFLGARPHLEQILAKDASYKFGDVSLAHCRCLCSLNETGLACDRLEQHLKRWPNPEAYVMLANLLIDRGDHDAARKCLEATLLDLRGGPAFFARQNRGWARQAKRLLSRLPSEPA